MKRKALFYLFLIGPLALMNLVWSYSRWEWLYWFSWAYLACEIILAGCLLIFMPKKVLEMKAFIENTEYKPLILWSEQHFACIYIGIILSLAGIVYLYFFIWAFSENLVPGRQ